jgi:cytochrome c5
MNKKIACVLLSAWILTGCDGLSDVGEQKSENQAPVADAVVLNHPFAKDASGNVSVTVRSGTEVFLSGKDSDGEAAPVLRYEWCQLSQNSCMQPPAALPLVLRNSNTVSFTAPPVMQDTRLQFRLTVTDAKGNTDSKNVTVDVVGVPDANHFLTYEVDRFDKSRFKLLAVTSQDVTAQQMGGNDVRFRITVRKLVDYTTPGVDGPYLEVDSQQFESEWSAAYGAQSSCSTQSRNPLFDVEKPTLDIDDIIARVNPNDPQLKPNPADVDDYRVKLAISIEVIGGALPSGVVPQVCAPEFGNVRTAADNGMLELTLEQILGAASNAGDTAASARAYYSAIDPLDTRTTLLDWLVENGFAARGTTNVSWSALAEAADAHAVYTNNFDLGFGRDMYARIVRCDGTTPQLGQPIDPALIGTCDIAAVVVNYASLEAAAKKLNPLLAVAMEYARTPGSGNRRIVQFYTFAPDFATGHMRRVLSANLDGRGEKYMPQVCTVCHGGVPGGLDPGGGYANAGDINATFLLWDLDSFLYSDRSGDHSDKSFTDETLRARYTRAAQEDSLRRLNQLAYLTYRDDSRPNRFLLAKQLVEGWYGKQNEPERAFTSTTFNGGFVPPGWAANGVDGVPNTADDNPADAPALYQDVFARSCRACHIAHAPSASMSGMQLEALTANGTTFNSCDATVEPGEPSWTSQGRQLPMACYRHLIRTPALASRISEGSMPFARLTMDRFWVDRSAESAGAKLQVHATAAGIPVGKPGIAEPCIDPFGVATGNSVVVQRNVPQRIATECSRFLGEHSWSFTPPDGSSAVLVGASTRSPVFVPDRQGDYTIQLSAYDGTQTSIVATVPVSAPVAGSARREVTIGAGGTGSIVVDVTTLAGFASIDPLTQIAIVEQSGVTAVARSEREIEISNITLAGGYVRYRLFDVDGDPSDDPNSTQDDDRIGRIDLDATTTLTAGDLDITVPVNGSSAPINLRSLIQPAFAQNAVTFRLVTAPSLSRFRGTGSVSAVTGGTTVYTAPKGVMTTYQNITVGTHDTFEYEACLIADPEECDRGTIRVRLEGSLAVNAQSFTGINNIARTTCASGCHENVQDGAQLMIFPAENQQSSKSLYCALRYGTAISGGSGTEAPGTAYANLTSPTQSLLYRKAGGLDNHGGGIPADDEERSAILNWIDQGAYFTEGPNQTCP